ncbi:MAG: DUF4331 family protein [Nannocystaceae bacterium]|nr:DUF4331 domain-containing protein [bacterium]
MALSTACVVDDDPAGDTDTDTNATTMTNTDPTNMTDPTASSTSTTDPSETDDPTVTDTDDTDTDPTDDTDTDTDTEAGDPDVYDFRDDDPASYARVDRKGFPAVNTALIAAENKDAYNASNPAGDVSPADTFAADAVATLQFLHGDFDPGSTGLNDDLVLANTLLGTDLTPCGVTELNNSCFVQAVPLAFPDVILINTGADSGFPNGRALDVPVIDIILAAVLIDVSDDPGTLLNAFANLGLSQSANDVAFEASFPYLGAAHE